MLQITLEKGWSRKRTAACRQRRAEQRRKKPTIVDDAALALKGSSIRVQCEHCRRRGWCEQRRDDTDGSERGQQPAGDT